MEQGNSLVEQMNQATEGNADWRIRDGILITEHPECRADGYLLVFQEAAKKAGLQSESITKCVTGEGSENPAATPFVSEEESGWFATEIAVPADFALNQIFLNEVKARARQLTGARVMQFDDLREVLASLQRTNLGALSRDEVG